MRDENVGKRRCSLKSECILAFIVSLYEDGLGFRLSFHKAGPIELHVRQSHWASNLSWPQTYYSLRSFLSVFLENFHQNSKVYFFTFSSNYTLLLIQQ